MFREKKGRYAAVNKPNTTSTNPFDEDYQEIELNTRPPALVSLRSLNPFDDEPQQPSPTPSTSSSAGLIEDGRSDNSYDERENRRKRFLGKLNKIENKLKKDDFNRAEVAFDPTDENGIVRYLVDKRGIDFSVYVVFFLIRTRCSIWISRHNWNNSIELQILCL